MNHMFNNTDGIIQTFNFKYISKPYVKNHANKNGSKKLYPVCCKQTNCKKYSNIH